VRCKRTLSWANLNDDIGLLRARSYRNLLENGFAREEVLTEASTQATILARLALLHVQNLTGSFPEEERRRQNSIVCATQAGHECAQLRLLALHFDAAVSKGNADSTGDGPPKCGSRPELGE